MSRKKMAKLKPIKRTPVPSLKNSMVDLLLVQKHKFKLVVNAVPGTKTVVFEPSLMKIVNCVLEPDFLVNNDIKLIFTTETKFIQNDDTGVYLFFVRSCDFRVLNDVCNQIKLIKTGTKDSEERALGIYVYLIPRQTKIAESFFEKYGLLCKITSIKSFGVDFIPLDSHLCTLSIAKSFKRLVLDRIVDIHYLCARAILKFESFFGTIKKKGWIGEEARCVYNSYLRVSKELGSGRSEGGSASGVRGKINGLIIFDRRADPITPLFTPLTYEALVDYLYGYGENGIFDYGKKIAKSDGGVVEQEEEKKKKKKTKVKKIVLNDDDEVFAAIRFQNIKDNPKTLTGFVKECREFEKKENYADDLKKMKALMEQIPRYQLKKRDLTCHLDISTDIRDRSPMLKEKIERERDILLGSEKKKCHDWIENMILTSAGGNGGEGASESLAKVLSMLALTSLVNDGIDDKHYSGYKEEMMKVFGIPRIMLILKYLRDIGLVVDKSSVRKREKTRQQHSQHHKKQRKSSEGGRPRAAGRPGIPPFREDYMVPSRMKQFRKIMNLWPTDQAECCRHNIHYVYTGYGALSVRLIHEFVRGNEKVYRALENSTTLKNSFFQNWKSGHSGPLMSGNIMVMFVGGVCRAEIASLKFLEKYVFHGKTKFLVMTTEVVSNMMDQFVEID